jgi:hypothetical protein
MATKSNKNVVPEARAALDKFKMEAASEVGVNLTQGYNGDLTSRQAGSVGGQMVNNMTPIRTKICNRSSRTVPNYELNMTYTYWLTVEDTKEVPEGNPH